MQDAGTARRSRASLLALAVLGSLLTVTAVLLAGWSAGLACYALAVTGCLAAVMQAARPAPALQPASSHTGA